MFSRAMSDRRAVRWPRMGGDNAGASPCDDSADADRRPGPAPRLEARTERVPLRDQMRGQLGVGVIEHDERIGRRRRLEPLDGRRDLGVELASSPSSSRRFFWRYVAKRRRAGPLAPTP